MAYTRENILQRMIDVQNITVEHTQRGVTQEWVFNNVIYPKYRISRKTFYNWLGEPMKQHQLQKIRAAKKAQMSIQF